MKVNISGKGVIPYINRIAPVMNIEVAEEILKKILKNPKFKIYQSDGFGQVTMATFSQPAPAAVEEKPVIKNADEVPGVVKEIIIEEKTPVVEEPLPEITEEVVAEEVVEEPTPVEEVAEVEECEVPVEETDVETFEEAADEVVAEEVEEATEEEVVAEEVEEETSEEETTEEAPKQTSKKKKKNRK